MTLRTNSTPISLYLEGFRTIEEFTEIEFKDLTLLFGPNSAGKSSIYHGLNLANKLFDHPEDLNRWTPSTDYHRSNYGIDHQPMARLVNPDIYNNWRRTGVTDTIDDFNQTMLIGVKLNRFARKDMTCTLIAKFHSISEADSGSDVRYSCKRDFELMVNDTTLFKFLESECFYFNYNHPYIKEQHKEMEYICSDISNSLDEKNIYLDGSHLVFKNRSYNMFINGLKLVNYDAFIMKDFDFDSKTESALTKEGQKAMKHIVSFYNKTIQENVPNLHSIELIPASRTVPTNSDMTIYLSPGIGNSEFEERNSERVLLYEKQTHKNWNYFQLAQSFVQQLPRYSPYPIDSVEDLLFMEVNKSLANEMFKERGYQLHANYSINIPYSEFEDIVKNDSEPYLDDFGVTVRILLKDSNGVILDFEDVGSGIGFVLPVLIAIHFPEDSFIQQPELHLHPTLQSSLADVFAGVLARNEYSERPLRIIETHSEHLLLRFLKRIRQTYRDNNINTDIKLFNKDIAVYYFDVNADSSTSVKHIRVSKSGEFMDPWPKGFFEERYEELFDE